MKKYNLAPGDFPEINDYRSKLTEQDFTKFAPLKQRLIDDAEAVLGTEFPRLMEALPRSMDSSSTSTMTFISHPSAPAFDVGNPFGDESATKTRDSEWALSTYIPSYQDQFDKVQVNGLVTGAAARGVLGGSGLPVAVLRQIWDLSDVGKDGQLSLHEFVIAMYLVDAVKQGQQLPEKLDEDMMPPSK